MVRVRSIIFLQFVVYSVISMAGLCGKRIHANIGKSSRYLKPFLVLSYVAARL